MRGQLLSDGYPCTGKACCRQCADGPCCVMPSLPSDGQLAFWRDMHPEWTSVGESATASGLAQSTTSEMLSALHAYGFIERRKSGKTVCYRPKAKVVVARNIKEAKE